MILNNFPKPSCDTVWVPRFDNLLKEVKGKDPHLYGSEKKLQDFSLMLQAPSHIFGDLLNKGAKVFYRVSSFQFSMPQYCWAILLMCYPKSVKRWPGSRLIKLCSLAKEYYSKLGPIRRHPLAQTLPLPHFATDIVPDGSRVPPSGREAASLHSKLVI